MSWNEEANIRCLLRYACPQLWSRLAATDTPDRRHCDQCDRDVHLVRNEKDFIQHAAHWHCVAVPVMLDDSSDSEGFAIGSPR
ncbi:MAG: hypothetical protein RL042_2156 [Nitrospirota bacterium]